MIDDIPAQEEGSEMDAYETVDFEHEAEAKAFYDIARQRLLEVYNWDKICGFASATFTLTDARGNEVRREVVAGDHFKINIPGPGTKVGEGFDWVVVEFIEEEQSKSYEKTMMRARPTPNPLTEQTDTAHFFKDKATSTFRVIREGHQVRAEVHGRNEIANSDTEILIDNIRNVLVGWGAKIGFSYPQWKSLVKAIVKTD